MGVEILFREESYRIMGACMKVHRSLGPGFLEGVYEEAISREFAHSGIPFRRQEKLNVYYEEQKLDKFFFADFICFYQIVLEIKAVTHMPKAFSSQSLNYLAATKMQLGILINFGTPSLTYKRIVNTNNNGINSR